MIGIYKITNTINNMCYIGQSNNIHRRWNNHKSVYNNKNAYGYNYYLYRAMRKYGIENFSFEIIEECSIDELNDREKYWIEYFDSYKNGYNSTIGGESSGHAIKITPDKLDQIDNLLKKSELSIQQIADMFDVSYEMIQGINTGRHWHRDNIEYPIGKYKIGCHINSNNEKNHCCDCGKEISNGSVRCLDCYLKYKSKSIPSQIELLQLLNDGNSKEAIGRMFQVTGNAVKKWCMKYGIPHTKNEVQEYVRSNNIKFK